MIKNKKLVIVTHNDRFHADDVFAMAVLQIIFGKQIGKVYRTRDEEKIKIADIVFDVGNIYDPKKNRFDHHQTEGAGNRENGIPYASFGLVWKKYGKKICGSLEIADIVDKKLIQSVDADDNGYPIFDLKDYKIKPYSLDRMCYVLGSTWKEKENYDKSFIKAVKIAKLILEREITYAKDAFSARKLVENAYKKTIDKRLLILDEYYPWSEFVEDKKEILFVIYPNKADKFYRVNTISEKGFMNRKDLPKKWAGLRDTELEKVTGIKGARFCHRKLFLAVADTKANAIELAKLALL
jgi:uncharacterized UPF0160 family protein